MLSKVTAQIVAVNEVHLDILREKYEVNSTVNIFYKY